MKYPIFITNDERSVKMHLDAASLNGYEEPEINSGLYEGWDHFGTPLGLEYDSARKTVYPVYTGKKDNEEALKKALEGYAKEYFKVDYSVEDNNFVDFYLRLEKEFGKKKIHYGKGFLFIGFLVLLLYLVWHLIGKLVGK